MKTFFKKTNRSTEKTLAYGGVQILESPLLLNFIVIAAIVTDFTCFLSSFTSQLTQDFVTCLILALTCATIIDTVPLAISRSIVTIFSPSEEPDKRRAKIILGISTFVFLSFFAFTAVVRFWSGPSLFNGGVLRAAQNQAAADADAGMTAGQTGMVVLTCALPFFTSAAVAIVGLFTDNNAKRRHKLRCQRNELVACRGLLDMQRSELEAALEENLEEKDLEELAHIRQYISSLGATMCVYVQLRLMQILKDPDDLSFLSRRSKQIAALEDQLLHPPVDLLSRDGPAPTGSDR